MWDETIAETNEEKNLTQKEEHFDKRRMGNPASAFIYIKWKNFVYSFSFVNA